jgi:ornithine carbamoyltransferase
MGQEEESARRLKDFAGYQITNELLARGGAAKDAVFMHCLPRHQDEVNDEVFYGDKSVVFQEAENRCVFPFFPCALLSSSIGNQADSVAFRFT